MKLGRFEVAVREVEEKAGVVETMGLRRPEKEEGMDKEREGRGEEEKKEVLGLDRMAAADVAEQAAIVEVVG